MNTWDSPHGSAAYLSTSIDDISADFLFLKNLKYHLGSEMMGYIKYIYIYIYTCIYIYICICICIWHVYRHIYIYVSIDVGDI